MKMLINIDVPELRSAVEFYCAMLGLTHTRTLDEDVAELSGGSSMIYLLKKDAGSMSSAATNPDDVDGNARSYRRHWTPVHIDFVVDDIAAAEKRALAAGAKKESECIEWRGSKCITFADPFGHGFCLIAFTGATYE